MKGSLVILTTHAERSCKTDIDKVVNEINAKGYDYANLSSLVGHNTGDNVVTIVGYLEYGIPSNFALSVDPDIIRHIIAMDLEDRRILTRSAIKQCSTDEHYCWIGDNIILEDYYSYLSDAIEDGEDDVEYGLDTILGGININVKNFFKVLDRLSKGKQLKELGKVHTMLFLAGYDVTYRDIVLSWIINTDIFKMICSKQIENNK